MFHDGSSWMSFGGGLAPFFWILIVIVIVVVIKGFGDGGRRDDHYESPLEILKKRYARGEIDQKEYERMKQELNG